VPSPASQHLAAAFVLLRLLLRHLLHHLLQLCELFAVTPAAAIKSW
jgi:hypothetical protein